MKIYNLSLHHSQSVQPFFDNLALELQPSKLNALHGKNGVGKTVLLQLLSEKTGASFLNQRFDMMIADRFTFAENLQFASLSKFPSPFSRLKKKRAPHDLLTQFHITPHIPAYQLSGGQRQILALLMALESSPSILLLDEPTAALDSTNAEMVFEFLAVLQDTTLLIVCHDKHLITRYTTGFHLTLSINQEGTRILTSSK